MGYSYLFNCHKCQYSQQLYEGHGFMIHDQSATSLLEANQNLLHYKTRQKIVELAQKHDDLHVKMEFKIYRCHQCLQLSDKLFIQVENGTQVLHKTRFKCANCKITLRHTNIHRVKFAICPKCKSNRFQKSKELVLWD